MKERRSFDHTTKIYRRSTQVAVQSHLTSSNCTGFGKAAASIRQLQKDQLRWIEQHHYAMKESAPTIERATLPQSIEHVLDRWWNKQSATRAKTTMDSKARTMATT
jgi:hypothetical protein